MKRYIAKTNVSINVMLANGKNVHVPFTPVTGGSSVYYTNDKEVQNALKRHYKYGKLFKEDVNYEEKKPKGQNPTKEETINVSPEETGTTENTPVESDEVKEGKTELKTISVSDPDAAKAYLAENFGISRTKLKTIKAIKETAESNGILFEGL